MTGDMEHLFMYLVTICISTFVRCLLKFLAYILIGMFVFLLWVLRVLCIFWIIVLYQIHLWQIFSPSLAMSSYSLDIYLILCCIKVCSFGSLVSLDCIFISVIFILFRSCFCLFKCDMNPGKSYVYKYFWTLTWLFLFYGMNLSTLQFYLKFFQLFLFNKRHIHFQKNDTFWGYVSHCVAAK